jgi:hypothetical protein
MERCIKPELLDDLPPADARAIRARKDLQRVNSWMGHADLMAQALRSTSNGLRGRLLVELGAGDGTFLLRVARQLGAEWRGTSALLLDRRGVVSPETYQGFEALDWQIQVLEAEALAWVSRPDAARCDTMLANLFLHHFSEAELTGMLLAAARQARVFVALEPRRSERSLLFSRLLWFIGCSHITRYDAPISVHAGFAGPELSQLWPAGQGWKLEERPVRSFSHQFIAQRRE